MSPIRNIVHLRVSSSVILKTERGYAWDGRNDVNLGLKMKHVILHPFISLSRLDSERRSRDSPTNIIDTVFKIGRIKVMKGHRMI